VDEIDGELDGGAQAADIGASCTCERQSRAMIHRSSNHRQTECHVDRMTEAGMFEYRQSLVVKHSEESIGVRHFARHESRIRRQRAKSIDAFATRSVDGRADMSDFFIAE
jgi:hypothetical protein